MLSIQNITIGYDVCEVVKDISFALRDGQILAVVGANGAGKTTLLRALNGTLPLMSGEIFLDEKPLEDYSRREIARKMTVIAQENETKFPMTVMDFVLAGRFARRSIWLGDGKRSAHRGKCFEGMRSGGL